MAREPFLTPLGLAGIFALAVLYAACLLAVGPEWVGWAGPLVFGGSLVATTAAPGISETSVSAETVRNSGLAVVIAFGVFTVVEKLRRRSR